MSNILMVGDEPIGQVGYFTEQESIAPVAESPTTSAISSGSHFMYNGVRMVATSAIASGATLVVYPTTGYNCKAESVEDNLVSETITFTSINGGINYVNGFRIGKLVVINFGIGEITANTVLFNVPEKYRPSSNKAVSQFMNTDSANLGTKTFTLIYTNGNVICDQAVFRGGVWLIYSL